MPRPDVCVVGLGYIGLPTAVILAESGLRVAGVDIRPDIVRALNRGRVTFEEDGLAERAAKVVKAKRLKAHLKPQAAHAYIVAVPTPITKQKRPDMTYVWAAAGSLGPVLQEDDLVILESTSPVGSTHQLARRLAKARPDLKGKLRLAYCPERIIPGNMFHELVHNDRIVGGLDEASTQQAAALYRRFVKGEVHETTSKLAEACKLAENAFRDVNIAYANELSMLCDRLGVDVWELIRLANKHPRVNILNPGIGVGGHCIPVDPWFLIQAAPELTPLMRTAREVNRRKSQFSLHHARRVLRRQPSATVAVLGLAYKPDTNDFRESPAMKIAEALAADATHDLLVVEPSLKALPPALDRPRVRLASFAEAIEAAGTVILLTGHKPFRAVDLARLAGKAVMDTQGIWKVVPPSGGRTPPEVRG